MNISLIIDPRHEEIVRNLLMTHLQEYEVWAFGSRVHGRNVSRYSDLDLVVITDNPLDINRLAQLKDAFCESNLPFKVDVLDWASITSSFREIIQQEYLQVKPGIFC